MPNPIFVIKSNTRYDIATMSASRIPNPVGARIQTTGNRLQVIITNHIIVEMFVALFLEDLKRVKSIKIYAIVLNPKNHHRSEVIITLARNPQNIVKAVNNATSAFFEFDFLEIVAMSKVNMLQLPT